MVLNGPCLNKVLPTVNLELGSGSELIYELEYKPSSKPRSLLGESPNNWIIGYPFASLVIFPPQNYISISIKLNKTRLKLLTSRAQLTLLTSSAKPSVKAQKDGSMHFNGPNLVSFRYTTRKSIWKKASLRTPEAHMQLSSLGTTKATSGVESVVEPLSSKKAGGLTEYSVWQENNHPHSIASQRFD